MYLGISSLVWVLGFLAVVAVLAMAASVFALSAAYLRVGPGTSRRGQRWFALALLLATGLAAWGVPRMIPDGISDLSAAEREAALEARGLAWQLFWENPLERLSITRIVVAHIEPLA